ncbi:MAG: alkaline phosphatase family protein [Candidatus Jordarchaeum sp.]|uniref:alkaline phosphatase family protein n=1 Tax=Candidatus Jordarchaeum sp. TaxID=2823881 RepID=UPI00404A4B6D
MTGCANLRALIIGLDGATWNILLPLVKRGQLPNIGGLMEQGVWGNLQSTYPFTTSPAWKSFSTGKNPGKLGLFSWCSFDIKNLELTVMASDPFRSKEIWDYLGELGLTSGVINLPLLCPPRRIKGFIISGFPMSDSADYTFPKDLKKTIVEKYDYKINPSGYTLDPKYQLARKNILVSEVEELIKKRFEVTKYLIKLYSPDFVHTTIFYTDAIQHFFWKEMENKDKRFGGVIKNIWKMIDSEIGKLLEQLEEDTNVLIMSDHGFAGLKAIFSPNNWFLENGYLNLSIFNILLNRLRLSNKKTSNIIRQIGLDKIVRRIISKEKLTDLQQKIIPPEVSGPKLIWQVDWGATKAICVGECGIFLNPELDQKEYETLRTLLIKEIKMIKNPKTGENLMADVKRKEEIYHGEHLELAPDLILIPNDGYRIYDSLMRSSWDYSGNPWSAYHTLQGIFIAYGPDIKNGYWIENATIYDLAPTILHMFNVPIPTSMDGRVLTEIFQESSELAKKEVLYRDVETEKIVIKEKIRKLKKLEKI